MLANPLAIVAVLFIFIRLFMMAFFPVVGDEAYYFYWGQHFAGGYYDLSPMIGWWQTVWSRASSNPLWLRLPNLLVMGAVSFGIYEWISKVAGRERARYIAALFFFSPIPFLAALISPDVPLLFFSFFAVLLFYQDRPRSYFFSGALWGAAFLSKYFAFFLLPAMVIWFLIQKRKKWMSVIWFTLGALPFLFQHLYWNSKHCWANFVFNLVTRQQVSDGALSTILILFVAYLFILATPILLVSVRSKDAIELEEGFEKIAELKKLRRYLLLMWVVPISFFAVTALAGKGQGLHWYLSYVPFFMMWVGLGLNAGQARSKLRQMFILTGVLALLGAAVSFYPRQTLGRFFHHRYTFDFNVVTLSHEFVSQLAPELVDVDFVFTDGYSQAAALDHAFRRYSAKTGTPLPQVNVWGEGSRFGRVFDWTIDWKSLEQKKVALITRGMPDLVHWQKYFLQFRPKSFEFGEDALKSQYFITIGTEFQANQYKAEVVDPAVHKFYPVEKLPFQTEGCSL